ncbi:MAG: 16S rRNA (cytosine(1402)-N(4))-methyltransferase RsmH [Candidatus Margulisiibacteriota bacterium]
MHVPALLKETLELLDPRSGRVFVDATLGFGGHAEALLKLGAKVVGIDRDAEAIATVRERLSGYPEIKIIQDNFSNIGQIIKDPVDGILFDLGISSYQIDEAQRGFSIRFDGPLDMRMDQSQYLTAEEIVNEWPEEELTRIFREYGEERFAKRIARAIIELRGIKTTGQLKAIVEKAIPTWRKRESVTRVFQALRIAVNSELENLKQALSASPEILKSGGRMIVISYHSLEDRMVKWFFRDKEKSGILKILTKRPIVAKEAEIAANPRAKSAKLRGAEKI